MVKNLLYIIISAVMGIGYGCKQKPVETPAEFHYYPKTNMYFNVEANHFIFSLDGAKTWDTLNAAAQTAPEVLGDKVVLYAQNDSIWIDNEAHRRAYNGILYDIFNADTITVSPAGMVTEKKIKKTSSSTKKSGEDKSKKGLKKLWNKIFGKRGDKNSND